MRQRLLLVAGWALAAVTTSLVASGAVAVAGGQVLDRPLRPLSAAEVAALPVAAAEFVPQRASPLPPAASLQNRDGTVEGAGRNVEPGSGGKPGPVGDRGAVESGVLDPTAENAGRPPVFVEPPPPDPVALTESASQTAVQHMLGGSASVAATDGRLLVLWAVPNPGYTLSLTIDSERRVTLLFSSDAGTSVFVAEISAEGTLITLGSDVGL